MGLAQHGRKILLALTLSFTLLFTAACGGTTVTSERTNQPALSGSSGLRSD